MLFYKWYKLIQKIVVLCVLKFQTGRRIAIASSYVYTNLSNACLSSIYFSLQAFLVYTQPKTMA
jgi:hypothetical protein